MREQDESGKQNVCDSHEGDDNPGYNGDPVNSTEYDQQGEQGQNDSQPDTACTEDFMKCQGNGICLYRVEYKSEGDGNDDCKKNT